MRTMKNYSLERDPFEKALLTYRDKRGIYTVELDAGREDEIDVFRERDLTLVLSHNRRLWYVGLQAFRGKEEIGSTFLQVDYEICDVLGKRELDLHPITMAKKMLEYLL